MLESPGRRGESATHDEIGIQVGAEFLFPMDADGGIGEETAAAVRARAGGRGRQQPGGDKARAAAVGRCGITDRDAFGLEGRQELGDPFPLATCGTAAGHCGPYGACGPCASHGHSAAGPLHFAQLFNVIVILCLAFFGVGDEGKTGKFGGFRVPKGQQGFGEIGGDGLCRDGHDGVFESAEGFVVEFDVLRVWVAAEASEPRGGARTFLDCDGCDVVRLHGGKAARML